jgi:hypothetical protein
MQICCRIVQHVWNWLIMNWIVLWCYETCQLPVNTCKSVVELYNMYEIDYDHIMSVEELAYGCTQIKYNIQSEFKQNCFLIPDHFVPYRF